MTRLINIEIDIYDIDIVLAVLFRKRLFEITGLKWRVAGGTNTHEIQFTCQYRENRVATEAVEVDKLLSDCPSYINKMAYSVKNYHDRFAYRPDS